MSRIIYERFRDVIPMRKISDCSLKDLMSDCEVAFEVIGYEPNHFNQSFNTVLNKSNAVYVYEFVYEVYMEDIL